MTQTTRVDATQRLRLKETILFGLVLLIHGGVCGAQRFTVATYNLESYLEARSGTRPAKSDAARAKVRESIRALSPDVLGLQEIGSTNALLELRTSLKREGLEYPHWEWVPGYDTNIQVAVLSKFPFVRRRPHTNEGFLLAGRRFHLSRGLAEVDIQVTPTYAFTMMVAHLKSKRPTPDADEADLREQEGLILREKIEACLGANPNANLVVVGDLNDTREAASTRAVIGKGKLALVDTRPAERNGDDLANPRSRLPARNVVWTHYYAKEETYSRLDYILLSRGMEHEWEPGGSYVLALPNWGLASDHRPVVARFVAQD